MRLRLTLPHLLAGALLLGACHADLSQPTTGTIDATVNGLPSGATVTFSVTGPNGFSAELAGSGSLTGLEAGTYTVAAPPVTDGIHTYAAENASYGVSVAADAISALTVLYSLSSGILDIAISGVPVTNAAAVVVTGPNAFNESLGATKSLSGLPAGNYVVLTASIDSGGHAFASAIDVQNIAIQPSLEPVSANIVYQLATGRATINISGLPSGIPGSVQINGPDNFLTLVTATETLIKLAPGDYAITVHDVQSGGHTFAANGSNLVVTPSRVTLQADVAYQQTTGELQLLISGLPVGVNSQVTVTGPNAFSQSISRNDTLVGLLPGTYNISADTVNSGGFVYEPLDFDQSVLIDAASAVTVNIAYAFTGSSSLDFQIPRAYLVQSVQRSEGDIRLVAGRDAMARIFVTANETNSVVPDARLRIYHNSSLVETFTLTADRLNTPTSISEQSLNASWNVLVPGNLIVEGMSIDIAADPGNAFPELNESNNAFPAEGQLLALDVRTLPPLAMTLVPVRQAQFIGNVTNGNADQFLDDTWRMFPSHQINWQVHDTVTTSAPTLMSGDQNNAWGTVLSEIRSLRIAEGASSYYYGVVAVNYNSGVAGLGYVPSSASSQSKAAIGWDYLPSGAEVLAHELGHNFGRSHAPCGGPSGVDPNYPYSNAIIGHFGFDIVSGVVLPSGRPDIMSYCNNPWVSDYTYEGIFARREAEAAIGPAPTAAGRSLLIWGRIREDSVILEPAFELDASPFLPDNSGPYSVQGIAQNGQTIFLYRFAGDEIADLPGGIERHFSFLIPVDPQGPPVHTLRLTGPGVATERTALAVAQNADPIDAPPIIDGTLGDRVHLQWNAGSAPMILVRDPVTGRILSFARGGDATIWTDRQSVELVISDGVRSRSQVVRR